MRGANAANRAAADADQTASDADQTFSDSDQTASERDDADAAVDQAASDDDQASADRAHPGNASPAEDAAYRSGLSARQAGTIRRMSSHSDRATTARRRGATAVLRDAIADDRDETARERDAARSEIAALVAKYERLRSRAAAARRRAARDRTEAARERTRLQAELHSAHLDELTGAYRRSMGELALNHEIERARRVDGQFVIAFVDVDDLKVVNDRDGHVAGDRVLETVVFSMRSHLRSFDPVVRFGGDEFVAGIAGVHLAEVVKRFALIDRSVKRAVGVGISVGLAELEPEETLDQLTARADVALLAAKKVRAAPPLAIDEARPDGGALH